MANKTHIVTFKVVNHNSPEYQEALVLREEILRKPFGLSFSTEELDEEKNHIHIVGFMDEEIIASAVLVPEGNVCKMQRVVVKNEAQNKGVGSEMLKFCESEALSRSYQEIYCHAREGAVRFYLNNHYLPDGDYFIEDTIPHLTMRKLLSSH